MKIFFSLVILGVILLSSNSYAAVDCGDFDCEDNQLCIDRGEGNDCWQTCRVDSNCESGCCVQIITPYTAWICGLASECSVSDGDDDSDVDLDDESESIADGDSAGIDIEQGGYGGTCGDTECNSWQICIVLDNNSEACATVCSTHSECASGCCALTSLGKRICLSADEECPADNVDGDAEIETEDDDNGCGKKGLFCESASSSFIMGMIMLAWLVRYLARRKFD